MTAEITSDSLSKEIIKFEPNPENKGWFNYAVHVYPHHTDYSGVVWHGCYVNWMEEARIESLRTVGMSFEDLLAAGVDLPVVEMSLRYHRSARMGDNLLVMTRLITNKIRLNWEYQIRTETDLCVTALVTLVAVDFENRKLLRSLPSSLEGAIAKLTGI